MPSGTWYLVSNAFFDSVSGAVVDDPTFGACLLNPPGPPQMGGALASFPATPSLLLDGTTPTLIADLPPSWTPGDAYEFNAGCQIGNAADFVDVTFVDPVISLHKTGDTGGPAGVGPAMLTGCTLAVLSAIFGQDITISESNTVGVSSIPVQVTASGVLGVGFFSGTYTVDVTLTIDPAVGPKAGGTAVTITGEGFTGVTEVTFGGTQAVSVIVVDDTSIRCVTPPHASGIVDVVVVGVGTITNGFTFVSVDRVSQAKGTVAGATPVTITGFGFNEATGVLFDATDATEMVIVSNTELTAVTPAHRSGVVDVTVTGVGVGRHLYTYTLAVPQNLGKGPLLPPIPTRRGV